MKQTRHKQTVCTNQQSEEWAKLIRKLRWIGMDEEAHHLQMAVRSLLSVPKTPSIGFAIASESEHIVGCSQLPSFSSACCATASSRDDG